MSLNSLNIYGHNFTIKFVYKLSRYCCCEGFSIKKITTDTLRNSLIYHQRVSEGERCDFFNEKALTTTIPAQFAKKFNAEIVPVYIERLKNNNFRLKIHKQLKFQENDSVEMITTKLNKILENMILNNPEQWIWTHNRWK